MSTDACSSALQRDKRLVAAHVVLTLSWMFLPKTSALQNATHCVLYQARNCWNYWSYYRLFWHSPTKIETANLEVFYRFPRTRAQQPLHTKGRGRLTYRVNFWSAASLTARRWTAIAVKRAKWVAVHLCTVQLAAPTLWVRACYRTQGDCIHWESPSLFSLMRLLSLLQWRFAGAVGVLLRDSLG